MITTLVTASPATANPLPGLLRVLRDAVLGKPAARSGELHALHELPRAHTLTLVEPLGHELECLAGCVWITLDSDPRDIVIESGQAFKVDRNRRTLVHALEGSLVRVTRPAR